MKRYSTKSPTSSAEASCEEYRAPRFQNPAKGLGAVVIRLDGRGSVAIPEVPVSEPKCNGIPSQAVQTPSLEGVAWSAHTPSSESRGPPKWHDHPRFLPMYSRRTSTEKWFGPIVVIMPHLVFLSDKQAVEQFSFFSIPS
jgi:hypothetical protein